MKANPESIISSDRCETLTQEHLLTIFVRTVLVNPRQSVVGKGNSQTEAASVELTGLFLANYMHKTLSNHIWEQVPSLTLKAPVKGNPPHHVLQRSHSYFFGNSCIFL